MSFVRARLSIMMFLQYFVWGSWGVEMGGYMGGELGFSGIEIGSIYSATALAAIVTPLLMGIVADRFLSTEKLLAILHLAGAGLLVCAAYSDRILEAIPALETQFWALYPLMIIYALFYMPTLALTNSISFENITDPEKEFPLIRVFGTFGWIAAGVVVGFILKAKPGSVFYDQITKIIPADSPFFVRNNFILMAAGTSALLGLYCLTLPYTPPKKSTAGKATSGTSTSGRATSGTATSGIGAPARDERRGVLELLRDPSFLAFTVASFLICIPLAFYYNLANLFLQETDAPYPPTALQTIGQCSEVIFMALMPMFIQTLGVKRMLAVGMLAWVVRYICFSTLNFPAVVFGLLLHGVCYDFFFVGSQIYVDSKADVTQRASAQGFIALVTLGLGMLVGAYAGGWVLDRYPPEVQVAVSKEGATSTTNGKPLTAPLPDWDIKGETGLAKLLNLKADATLDVAEIPQTFRDSSGTVYRRRDLKAALAKVDVDNDGRITRPQWRAAQAHDWRSIWMWPAVAAAATLVFFWIGFREHSTATG